MTEEDLIEVRHYYEIARKFKRLSPAETTTLFEAMRLGYTEARNTLIESNLLLVIKIAQQLFETYHASVPLPDLIQEGNIGLIHAVDRFDVDRSELFSAFAGHIIAQHIQLLLDTSTQVVRLPFYIGQTRRAVYRAMERLTKELGREPSIAEVAASTNIAANQINMALSARVDVVSLQSETVDGMTIESLLQSAMAPPAEYALGTIAREEVRALMARLEERERLIIELAYGLNDQDEYSLRQIGNQLGLSYERVRQIKDRAVRLLRTRIEPLGTVSAN